MLLAAQHAESDDPSCTGSLNGRNKIRQRANSCSFKFHNHVAGLQTGKLGRSTSNRKDDEHGPLLGQTECLDGLLRQISQFCTKAALLQRAGSFAWRSKSLLRRDRGQGSGGGSHGEDNP